MATAVHQATPRRSSITADIGSKADWGEYSFSPPSEIVPLGFFIKGILSNEACLEICLLHVDSLTQRPFNSIKHDQISGLYVLAWVNLCQ
jgi:hypothetical protein